VRYHSKLYYPNQWAASYFMSYAAVFGDRPYMVYKMLGLADMVRLGWENFPLPNMQREIDFADLTAYTLVYNDMFGPENARRIMVEAGKRWFETLRPLLPDPVSLRDVADLFTEHSDQQTLYEVQDDLTRFIIKRCPFCWRPAEFHPHSPYSWLDKLPGPVCAPWLGVLRAACPTASHIEETECIAKGGEACIFELRT
jgi:predicted hydrocarbon binding protein